MGKLLTSKEVAERLRVGQATILKWTRIGLIPHIRINKKVLFDETKIENFIIEKSRR